MTKKMRITAPVLPLPPLQFTATASLFRAAWHFKKLQSQTWHKDSLCLFANLNEVLYLLQRRGLVLGDWDVVDGEAFHGAAGQGHLGGEADQVGDALAHQGLHLALGGGD